MQADPKRPVQADVVDRRVADPMTPKALVTCDDPVLKAEYEFVLKCFDDLKAQEDAELRISVTRARESKQIEIIYAGVHKKRSLEPLRAIYRARDKGGVIRR